MKSRIAQLYLLVLLLRLFMPWMGATFHNPVAQAIFKLTSPLVVPVRRVGRPVSRGREDFRDEKTARHVALFHRDRVDMAQVRATAAVSSALPSSTTTICWPARSPANASAW